MLINHTLPRIVAQKTTHIYFVRDDILQQNGYACWKMDGEGPFIGEEELERLVQQTTSMHTMCVNDDVWYNYTIFFCCDYDKHLSAMHISTELANHELVKDEQSAEDDTSSACYLAFREMTKEALLILHNTKKQ